jgi:hypothetical protein
MYFITPSYSVAFNAKVASSTLSRAIIAAFHLEQANLIQTAAYPEGKGPDNTQAHFLCPKEKTPSKPVVLVVREPIARFRAAMAQTRLTNVDAALNALEQNGEVKFPKRSRKIREDVHFKHQHELAQPSAKVFKLEDLDAAATYIGLPLPLPIINEATGEKPTLTPEQEARVLAYYAEDKALYDTIPEGGMDYTYTPSSPGAESEPVPTSITATQIRLWLVRNGITMAQVSEAIAAIPDQQARTEAEVLWEYAPYVERTNPLVAAIAAGFNMADAAIDQAFREAAHL